MSKQEVPYKIYLTENELPKEWYNVRADMKTDHRPLLNPATLQPVRLDQRLGRFHRNSESRLGFLQDVSPLSACACVLT